MSTHHPVQDGECLASIAFEYGFAIATLWNHGENQLLRDTRESPYVLKPGDDVFVPERVPKQLPCPTDIRHRFRRRDVPEILRLQLLDAEHKPRPNLKYTLIVDKMKLQGVTDAAGRLRHGINPGAKRARLLIGDTEEFELGLGRLFPADEETGIRARLTSLGYLASEEEWDDPEAVYDAICIFQMQEHLEITGELDAKTRALLKERHGS